jgi:type III pantothenate kinase
MLLAIDVGNTAAKIGFFDDDELLERRALSRADELDGALRGRTVERAVLSSVSPRAAVEARRLLAERGVRVVEATSRSPFSFEIDYKTPDKLGVDRLCGVEGALELLRREGNDATTLATFDCGTATTANFLVEGRFVGGYISAGVETGLRALARETSLLPEVEIDPTAEDPGVDPRSGMISGALMQAAGFVEKCARKLPDGVPLFLAGGAADRVRSKLDVAVRFERDLTLYGLLSLSRRT